MAPLATADDLKRFLATDEVDQARADFILEGVTDEIRRFTGQQFGPVAGDIIALDGSGTNLLLLPGLPVTDVTEILEGGVVLDPSSYEWSATGMLRRIDGLRWAQRFRHYVATYDHGEGSVPPVVKMLTVRVAARAWVNPTGLTNENVGAYGAGYAYDATRFPSLTETDKDVLRGFMGS